MLDEAQARSRMDFGSRAVCTKLHCENKANKRGGTWKSSGCSREEHRSKGFDQNFSWKKCYGAVSWREEPVHIQMHHQ